MSEFSGGDFSPDSGAGDQGSDATPDMSPTFADLGGDGFADATTAGDGFAELAGDRAAGPDFADLDGDPGGEARGLEAAPTSFDMEVNAAGQQTDAAAGTAGIGYDASGHFDMRGDAVSDAGDPTAPADTSPNSSDMEADGAGGQFDADADADAGPVGLDPLHPDDGALRAVGLSDAQRQALRENLARIERHYEGFVRGGPPATIGPAAPGPHDEWSSERAINYQLARLDAIRHAGFVGDVAMVAEAIRGGDPAAAAAAVSLIDGFLNTMSKSDGVRRAMDMRAAPMLEGGRPRTGPVEDRRW